MNEKQAGKPYFVCDECGMKLPIDKVPPSKHGKATGIRGASVGCHGEWLQAY